MNTSKNLLYSLKSIFLAFKYIFRNPKIWHLIIIPIFLNILLSILFFSFVSGKISELIYPVLEYDLIENFGFIYTILNFLTNLIVILITIFLFLILGMIIGAPFNGLIVEKLLDEKNIKQEINYHGFKLILFELMRAIKFEFTKILVIIITFIITSFLNLVPIIGNTFFVIISFGVTAYINGLDLSDSGLSRQNLSFSEKSKNFLKNWDLNFPFAIVSTFILTIPLINFLYLPIGNIAATMLILKSIENSKSN